MSKLLLKKDEAHKGYYTDEDGNLYVFRFGGRPIKVDSVREDKPNENYQNKVVEIEKSEVLDHSKTRSKSEDKEFDELEKTYDKKNTIQEKSDLVERYQNTQGASDDWFIEEGRKIGMSEEELASEIYDRKGADTANVSDDRINKLLARKEKDRWNTQLDKELKVLNDKSSSKELKDFVKSNVEGTKTKVNEYSEYEKKFDNNIYEKDLNNYKNVLKEYDEIREKWNNSYGTADYDKLNQQYKDINDKRTETRQKVINSFHNTIPYNELFNQAKEITGIDTTFTEPTVDEKGYVKYTSENIKDQSGLFGKILKDVRLENFSSQISFDEKTNEPYYWGTMDLRYQHNNGGSNGMQVMAYTYSPKSGWEFRDTEDNIYRNGKKLNTVADYAEYFINHGYTKEAAIEIANKKIAERQN